MVPDCDIEMAASEVSEPAAAEHIILHPSNVIDDDGACNDKICRAELVIEPLSFELSVIVRSPSDKVKAGEADV